MTIYLTLVLSLISVAFAQETFTYPKNGTVCVKATFDAVFQLSFTDDSGTYFANFSLPAESTIEVDGSCASSGKTADTASLTLNMTSQSSYLIFTFNSKDDNVTADVQFVLYDPSEVFENLNYTSVVTFVGPGVEFTDMGTVNNSYLCNAVENITLASNQSSVSASVTILYTNLQIQAFNFKDNFSVPHECEDDDKSTSTSTTSTTMMTTTLPTPTGTGHYSLTVGNETCALMVANISVSVHYKNQEGKSVAREVMVPADANVTGSCADDMIEMNLQMADEEDATGMLNFTFENDRGYTLLKECAFSFTFNDTNTSVEAGSKPDEAFSLSSLYFQCDKQIIQVGVEDQVILQDLKVQAFSLRDGNFSTEKLDCHKPVPKTAPTQNYTVVSGNTTCISMSAALTLEVKYTVTNKTNQTVTLNFEKDEPASGSCSSTGNAKERITIKYKQNDFQITFEFGRDGTTTTTGVGDEPFNYYVENVLIDYNLGSELFPSASDPTKKTAMVANQTLYKTGSDKYYKCSAEDTLKVDDWVSVKTKDLRFVAFHTDAKEPNLFGDNFNECTADTVTNSIVPIAVGAALAGLVVIVLIAYLIGRRRNHKGYESV